MPSTSDRQWLFLQDVALLIQYAASCGFKLTGGDLYRNQAYTEQFSSGVLSKHHQRLAIDLNLFIDDVYQPSTEAHAPLGEFWESLRPDNSWGGHFQDGNHYSVGESA